MTPPIDDIDALRRILATTDALLLDFDGPICSVFSGIPDHVVADQLRDILAQGGHTNLRDDVGAATDPFDVLFYAATLGPNEARYVEAAFTAHEVEAVQTAQPTPGAHDLIHAWKATNRPLAIVSNNSAAAVETYLNLHELTEMVDAVTARTSADVTLLKPNPHLVLRSAKSVGKEPSRCALIGDSPTDLEAAAAANMAAIAFANKPRKYDSFSGFGAVAIRSLDPVIALL